MKLEIEYDKLNSLLLEKKEYIGRHPLEVIINIGGGISFGVTLYSAKIQNYFINTALYIVVLSMIVIGFLQLRKCSYNSEKLIDDIKNLSVSNNKYSLIAIMNTYERNGPNKALLKLDQGWENTYLFPYFQTSLTNDEENIKHRIASSLNINIEEIGIRFLTQEDQPKWSPRHKKVRQYQNKYYLATIRSFPEHLKQDTFILGNANYKWMTLEKMENDKKIQEHNKDVLRTFERNNIFVPEPSSVSHSKQSPIPANVCIRLNRQCNLSCVFCLANNESQGLNTEEIKKSLSILKSNGVKRARLCGGEPTLRHDFIEIVRYCIDLGFETLIYSNLYDIDNVIEDICNLHVSVITSIHGTQSYHDSIVQRDGAYQQTCLNIKKLINAKIPVSIHMVLMNENYPLVEDVIKESINLKATKITIQTLIPRGRGNDLFPNKENESDLREKLKSLVYLKKKYENKIQIHLKDLYTKPYYVLETDGAIYLESSVCDTFIRDLL